MSQRAGSRAGAIVVIPGGVSLFPADTGVAAGLRIASRACTGEAEAPVLHVIHPLLIALEC